MIRALYTSSSGMIAQQTNIDVLSNNISNAGTTGFKRTRPAFKDSYYTAMERRIGEDPVNLQVGSGVKVSATQRSFVQGAMLTTGEPLNLAVDGNGFFMVEAHNGDIRYTRDGNFHLSAPQGGFPVTLTTSNGDFVLDEWGNPIRFAEQYVYNVNGEMHTLHFSTENIQIDSEGYISLYDGNVRTEPVAKLALIGFINPQGLEAVGNNYYMVPENEASGQPLLIGDQQRNIRQGFLEASNVDIGDEMTQLIIAQRAYQLNSRVLQSADEMERLANSLRG